MQEPRLQKEIGKNCKQQTKLNVILTDTPMIVFEVEAEARAAYERQHVVQW